MSPIWNTGRERVKLSCDISADDSHLGSKHVKKVSPLFVIERNKPSHHNLVLVASILVQSRLVRMCLV